MSKNWLSKMIGSKKRYNEYKARRDELPETYRKGVIALENYMWNFAKGEEFMQVLENILQLMEEASIDERPLKDIVGEDPVAFADAIMAEYPEELWFVESRRKLNQQFRELGE